jgi:hypothetical protein
MFSTPRTGLVLPRGPGVTLLSAAPTDVVLPPFDLRLRGDGVLGPGKRPVSNEPRDIIPSGETISLLSSVLSNAAGQVVRHPDVEHSRATDHDVGWP